MVAIANKLTNKIFILIELNGGNNMVIYNLDNDSIKYAPIID